MLHLAGSAPDNRPIFRIAYASRAAYPMPSGEVVTLAADAADKNRRNAVSGVLFSGDGVFVQWLEGPQDAVCPLMARIEADPRHRDVAILSSGWAPTRRYRRWPMRLAQTPVQANNARRRRGPFAPCDAPGAMAAFDAMAETHRRRDAQAAENAALHAAFANRLINAALEKPTRFPAWARDDLGARAQFVDDVCAAFMAGWRDDRWSSAEIGVGMAHLHRLWRRAGRAPDPAAAGRAVAIVVPPGGSETLGAIVKADLLRAAGVWAQMVCAPDAAATIEALAKADPDAVIVTSSRIGWRADALRAGAFGDFIRAHLPRTPVYVGGRESGPLRDWPRRIRNASAAPARAPSRDLDWLALRALASVRRPNDASWIGGDIPTPTGARSR